MHISLLALLCLVAILGFVQASSNQSNNGTASAKNKQVLKQTYKMQNKHCFNSKGQRVPGKLCSRKIRKAKQRKGQPKKKRSVHRSRTRKQRHIAQNAKHNVALHHSKTAVDLKSYPPGYVHLPPGHNETISLKGSPLLKGRSTNRVNESSIPKKSKSSKRHSRLRRKKNVKGKRSLVVTSSTTSTMSSSSTISATSTNRTNVMVTNSPLITTNATNRGKRLKSAKHGKKRKRSTGARTRFSFRKLANGTCFRTGPKGKLLTVIDCAKATKINRNLISKRRRLQRIKNANQTTTTAAATINTTTISSNITTTNGPLRINVPIPLLETHQQGAQQKKFDENNVTAASKNNSSQITKTFKKRHLTSDDATNKNLAYKFVGQECRAFDKIADPSAKNSKLAPKLSLCLKDLDGPSKFRNFPLLINPLGNSENCQLLYGNQRKDSKTVKCSDPINANIYFVRKRNSCFLNIIEGEPKKSRLRRRKPVQCITPDVSIRFYKKNDICYSAYVKQNEKVPNSYGKLYKRAWKCVSAGKDVYFLDKKSGMCLSVRTAKSKYRFGTRVYKTLQECNQRRAIPLRRKKKHVNQFLDVYKILVPIEGDQGWCEQRHNMNTSLLKPRVSCQDMTENHTLFFENVGKCYSYGFKTDMSVYIPDTEIPKSRFYGRTYEQVEVQACTSAGSDMVYYFNYNPETNQCDYVRTTELSVSEANERSGTMESCERANGIVRRVTTDEDQEKITTEGFPTEDPTHDKTTPEGVTTTEEGPKINVACIPYCRTGKDVCYELWSSYSCSEHPNCKEIAESKGKQLIADSFKVYENIVDRMLFDCASSSGICAVIEKDQCTKSHTGCNVCSKEDAQANGMIAISVICIPYCRSGKDVCYEPTWESDCEAHPNCRKIAESEGRTLIAESHKVYDEIFDPKLFNCLSSSGSCEEISYKCSKSHTGCTVCTEEDAINDGIIATTTPDPITTEEPARIHVICHKYCLTDQKYCFETSAKQCGEYSDCASVDSNSEAEELLEKTRTTFSGKSDLMYFNCPYEDRPKQCQSRPPSGCLSNDLFCNACYKEDAIQNGIIRDGRAMNIICIPYCRTTGQVCYEAGSDCSDHPSCMGKIDETEARQFIDNSYKVYDEINNPKFYNCFSSRGTCDELNGKCSKSDSGCVVCTEEEAIKSGIITTTPAPITTKAPGPMFVNCLKYCGSSNNREICYEMDEDTCDDYSWTCTKKDPEEGRRKIANSVMTKSAIEDEDPLYFDCRYSCEYLSEGCASDDDCGVCPREEAIRLGLITITTTSTTTTTTEATPEEPIFVNCLKYCDSDDDRQICYETDQTTCETYWKTCSKEYNPEDGRAKIANSVKSKYSVDNDDPVYFHCSPFGCTYKPDGCEPSDDCSVCPREEALETGLLRTTTTSTTTRRTTTTTTTERTTELVIKTPSPPVTTGEVTINVPEKCRFTHGSFYGQCFYAQRLLTHLKDRPLSDLIQDFSKLWSSLLAVGKGFFTFSARDWNKRLYLARKVFGDPDKFSIMDLIYVTGLGATGTNEAPCEFLNKHLAIGEYEFVNFLSQECDDAE